MRRVRPQTVANWVRSRAFRGALSGFWDYLPVLSGLKGAKVAGRQMTKVFRLDGMSHEEWVEAENIVRDFFAENAECTANPERRGNLTHFLRPITSGIRAGPRIVTDAVSRIQRDRIPLPVSVSGTWGIPPTRY